MDGQNTPNLSGQNPGTFNNPLGPNINDLNSFLKLLLDFVTQLAIPLIVLALIYTGFLFISAQGNAEKLKDARKIFMWTIIGAAIILGANVLLSAISGTVDQIRRGAMYEQNLKTLSIEK